MIREIVIKEDEIFSFEMANFRIGKFGLPINIFMSFGKNYPYVPRIKVQQDYNIIFKENESFVITINRQNNEYEIIGNIGEIRRKDIKETIKFIKLNKLTILKYWDGKYDADDLVKNLKSI